jgi:hypothetical protein
VTTTYNLTQEIQSTYATDENGKVTVTVRSKTPLKPRAIYVGEAAMQVTWNYSNKGSHWQFTPTIIEPLEAKYTSEMNGPEQVITIDAGKALSASGMFTSNVCGELRAPAIQFDLPYATDLWLFILRSPQRPVQVTADKAMLNIAHTLAYVTAEVQCGDSLHTYVTMHGEGFMDVFVNLKRETSYCASEETLTELKYGASTVNWKPTVRDFDVLLTTWSAMGYSDFLGLLEALGADVEKDYSPCLKGDFVLCDGPAIKYTLTLKGEKKYIGKEEDKTAIKLGF